MTKWQKELNSKLEQELNGLRDICATLQTERDYWKSEAERLEFALRAIGDKAVVDWDDSTVGEVGKVVTTPAPKKYIEWYRELMKRNEDCEKLRL